MANWNIHEYDGRYVGQHSSANPVLAFCEYMSLYEPRPSDAEVSHERLDDVTYQISYSSREFILTETN